jgi:hypothetical protein
MTFYRHAASSSLSFPPNHITPKKGVTVIEGIKTDKNDTVVGSGFSVVVHSITVTPFLLLYCAKNACILAAR